MKRTKTMTAAQQALLDLFCLVMCLPFGTTQPLLMHVLL